MTPGELPLNEYALVSVHEIAESSGFSTDEIRELVELGVFEPHDQGGEEMFVARTIELARVARRLQTDFELPLAGVALALAYRERVRELEARLQALECLLPGHGRG